MSAFSDNLTKYREKANISRKELAAILGVSVASIGFYETGRNEPDLQKLVTIATALHVSVDDLLGYHVDGFDKARAFSAMEIRDGKYNLDLCGFPHTEEEIKPPLELIEDYQRKRSELNAKIDTVLSDIVRMIKEAQK